MSDLERFSVSYFEIFVLRLVFCLMDFSRGLAEYVLVLTESLSCFFCTQTLERRKVFPVSRTVCSST